MNEFIEQLHKDLIEKAKESMDGHYAMIEPIIIDWRHIESALKESYTKGVEDAIKKLVVMKEQIIGKIIKGNLDGKEISEQWVNVNSVRLEIDNAIYQLQLKEQHNDTNT